jgi:hypothetical protein
MFLRVINKNIITIEWGTATYFSTVIVPYQNYSFYFFLIWVIKIKNGEILMLGFCITVCHLTRYFIYYSW